MNGNMLVHYSFPNGGGNVILGYKGETFTAETFDDMRRQISRIIKEKKGIEVGINEIIICNIMKF